MSQTAYEWVRALHIFGVLMWVGTMISLLHILAAHARAEIAARPAFHALERATAIAMDVGGTIAIVSGLILLFKMVPSPLKTGGYMHAKLTLVFLFLFLGHGFLRAKVRKYRESIVKPIPPFVPPLFSLVALAVIVLVVVQPF